MLAGNTDSFQLSSDLRGLFCQFTAGSFSPALKFPHTRVKFGALAKTQVPTVSGFCSGGQFYPLVLRLPNSGGSALPEF